MSPSPPATGSQALLEVADCARVTADMLREFDRDDLADVVAGYAARPSRDTPIVVVVGETKRGKSSLVNALLGRPGLSPVDVDVATLVHITFRYAEAPTAQVFVRGQQVPVDIDVDELFDWACEQGNPGNEKGVTAIEVRLPVPMLRNLTLIDTPGVGGLELGHGELTLQALATADAVLFVVDAGAPISKTELTFLTRAAERIDTVALVLTKIDAHPEWRQIQSDDLELLRAHLPQVAVAPYPVSNVIAELALQLGDTPDGRRERYRSGLDGVERVLSEYVANRAHLLWGANTMRFCLRAVADMKQLAGQQLAVADGDPALQSELEAEQARLAQLAPAEALWRAQLSASLTQLKNDRSHELKKRLEELKAKYDKLAEECANEVELQQLGGQFVAAVDAMTVQLAQETAAKVFDDVIGVIDVIAEDTTLRESLSQIGTVAVENRPQLELAGQKRRSALDIYMEVMPFLGVQRLVSMFIPGLGGIAGLVLGDAPATLMAKQRRAIARKNAFAAWTQRYVAAARDDDTHTFVGRVNDAQVQLVGALDAGIKRRVTELAAARERLAARMRGTNSQRAAAVNVAQQRLARVDALNGRVQTLLVALQRQRAADAPPVEESPQLAAPS
jgi:hypothetical protein